MALDKAAVAYVREHSHEDCPGWAPIQFEPPGRKVNYAPLQIRTHMHFPEPDAGETAVGLYDADVTISVAYDAEGKQAPTGPDAMHVPVAAGVGFVLLTNKRLCGSLIAAEYLGGKFGLEDDRLIVFSLPHTAVSDVTAEISRKTFGGISVNSVCAYNVGETFGGVHCVVREEVRKLPGDRPTATRKIDSSGLLADVVQAVAKQRLAAQPHDAQAARWQELSESDLAGQITAPGAHIALNGIERADAARQSFLRALGSEFRSL
ncbi:MAG: hypothetical protein ABSC56_04930 [Solirubrobacteraceae bacterium]